MLLQDIRYSLRTLARAPGFAMVAILSLALGIGANTAIFTLVDTVLLRSLPVKSPNRLVLLAEARRSGPHFNFSYPTYKDFRDRNEVFSGVLACFPISLSLSVADQAERISGELVSGNYFEVLGVGALAGRIFGPSEDQTPGGHPVAVLSYGFWQRRFGADPAIVGQTIRLNGLPFTVIGITPARFASTELGFSPDIRAPMMMQPQLMTGQDLLHTRTTNWLSTVARLKPGVTLARAQAAMDTLYRQVRQAEVQAFGDIPPVRRQQLLEDRLLVLPGSQGVSEVRRELSTPLLVLMAVVGTVLLIACANVANLLLARGAARRKEIAVRLALGAGRLRLVRQLLAESTLLACAGGAAGLLFALWGEWGLLALLAQSGNSISLDVHTDARVLAFTAVVSLLTGVLFGLAPALQATRTPVGPVLQDLPEASGPLRFGPRRALIAGQIALSVVLLAGAGLFVHTLRNLQSVSLGFERDHLLLLSLDPGLNDYSPQEGRAFFDRLLERVRGLPGVGEAGLAQIGPLPAVAYGRATACRAISRTPARTCN